MKVVLQRVKHANVRIDGNLHAKINTGILLFIGIEHADTSEDIEWLSSKIAGMRIFNDENGKMNRSVNEIEGECLLISQFTLHASTAKGNRPSFIQAARPEIAIPLYEEFKLKMNAKMTKEVQSGIFGADMQVELLNDGPVTILLDSKLRT